MFSEEEAALINRVRVCRLATVSRGCSPHVVPVCHAFDGEKIYIATDEGTRKVRNIESNPRVAVVFDEYFEPWGRNRAVLVIGRAEVLRGGEEYERAARLLTDRFPYYKRPPYGPLDPEDTPIISIKPEKVVSWGLRRRRRK